MFACCPLLTDVRLPGLVAMLAIVLGILENFACVTCKHSTPHEQGAVQTIECMRQCRPSTFSLLSNAVRPRLCRLRPSARFFPGRVVSSRQGVHAPVWLRPLQLAHALADNMSTEEGQETQREQQTAQARHGGSERRKQEERTLHDFHELRDDSWLVRSRLQSHGREQMLHGEGIARNRSGGASERGRRERGSEGSARGGSGGSGSGCRDGLGCRRRWRRCVVRVHGRGGVSACTEQRGSDRRHSCSERAKSRSQCETRWETRRRSALRSFFPPRVLSGGGQQARGRAEAGDDEAHESTNQDWWMEKRDRRGQGSFEALEQFTARLLSYFLCCFLFLLESLAFCFLFARRCDQCWWRCGCEEQIEVSRGIDGGGSSSSGGGGGGDRSRSG